MQGCLRALYAGGFALAGYFRQVKFLRAFRPYKYPSLQYNVMGDLDHLLYDNFFIFWRPDLTGRFEKKKQPVLIGLAFTPIIVIGTILLAIPFEPNGLIGFSVIVGAVLGTLAAILGFIDALGILIEIALRHNIFYRIFETVYDFVAAIIKKIRGNVNPRGQTAKIIALVLISSVVLAGLAVMIDLLIAIVGVVVVGGLTIFGISFALLLFSDKLLVLLDRVFAMSAKENDYGKITELLCAKEEDNLRPNYNYIPKKQRTVRLWARDLKNKVCKPMQS